jgi:hypothetical protein
MGVWEDSLDTLTSHLEHRRSMSKVMKRRWVDEQ